jgi:hypothetical protein
MQMAERLTKRTPEVEDRIIEGLCDGIPLRELCRQAGMPNWRTVYDWISADADLAARIAHARDLGFDAIAEDILDIADDGTNDWVERKKQDGSTDKVIDSEHVQRSKLRIETRLKLLAKWSPAKYGDKSTTALTGPDGGAIKTEAVGAAPDAMRDLTEVLLKQAADRAK